MRRVVITGAGTINALGHDLPSTKAALAAGTSAIAPLDVPLAERLMMPLGAKVQGFDPAAHFEPKQLALLDRFAQFAVVAAREAMAQAALDLDAGHRARAGTIIGTSGGGLITQDESYRAVYEAGKNRVHPFTVPRLMGNAAAAHVSMDLGLMGPSFAVSSACASSNHALAQGALMIRAGEADVMLAGGAEAMLCFGGLKAWEGLRVMSPDGCRPFDAARSGLVQGEGAAVFVLENYDHAAARGAPILAELAGACQTSDAADIVLPSGPGAVRAMAGALFAARLSPADIGYINAHGTGTRANDVIEAGAIREVFAGAQDVLVSSTKSMHGHAIGAAGAIELVACLLALDGTVPATVGLRDVDPEIDLNLVMGAAVKTQVHAVLSNAFAFGGHNAVICLKSAP